MNPLQQLNVTSTTTTSCGVGEDEACSSRVLNVARAVLAALPGSYSRHHSRQFIFAGHGMSDTAPEKIGALAAPNARRVRFQ